MADDGGLDHTADMVHGMAEDFSRSQKSAEGINVSLKSVLSSVVGVEAFHSLVKQIQQRSESIKAISKAINVENLNQLTLTRATVAVEAAERVIKLTALAENRALNDLEKVRLDVIHKQSAEIQAQRRFVSEIESSGKTQLGLMAGVLALGADLFAKQRQFNQDLIEANSTWQHRGSLMRETLLVQTQIGVGFEKATEASRALVHYGMDLESTYGDNLKLVVQMDQGLGVAVTQSAQLASIVERQLKGSFSSVANVVAQIVEDTALAGDEAVRLATNISSALGRLRPGLGAAGLPEVVKLVGRYESALKEVGGQSGAIQQLLANLTTPEGMVGAGALQVNPEFLSSAKGVQTVMDRFAKYGEMLVGQSQGWERQMRLQALAQQFNITSEQASQMLIAIKRANEQQSGQITLQERWRNQLHSTDQGIHRLINSLTGLLQGGLYPFVFVVGAVINKVADFAELILKYKEVAYTLMAGVALGTLVLSVRMIRLTASLWSVVMSTNAVTAAMARLSAVQAGTSLAGGATKAGMLASALPTASWAAALGYQMQWLRLSFTSGGITGIPAALRGLTSTGAGLMTPLVYVGRALGALLSPLGLLTAVAGGLLIADYKLWSESKRLADATTHANQIIVAKQNQLDERHRVGLYGAARYGEADDVLKKYASLVRDSATMFPEIGNAEMRGASQKKWVDDQLALAQESIKRGLTTRTMFTELTERTPEEQKRDEEMKGLTEKMLKVNEDQKGLLDKSMKRDQQTEAEEAVERAKDRLLRMGTSNFRTGY